MAIGIFHNICGENEKLYLFKCHVLVSGFSGKLCIKGDFNIHNYLPGASSHKYGLEHLCSCTKYEEKKSLFFA